MADFQQYTFQQGRRVGQLDLSAANAWESLSNTMSSFSSSIVSYQQGVNKQHNAEVKAYINSQEDDIITHISKLSIDHESDYETFIEKAQSFKKVKMDAMSNDEELGADFASGFGQMADDKIAQYGEKVYAKKVKLDKALQFQTAEENIEAHAVDTEHLIDAAINTYYNEPQFSEGYLKSLTPIFQTQRDMFGGKIDAMIGLGLSGESAFKKEQALLERFYIKAVNSELTANLDNGNAWQTIQDFDTDPSKFFSSKPQLQALFPEVKIAISDKSKQTAVTKMLQRLNAYQGQQDRLAGQRADATIQEQQDFLQSVLYLNTTEPGVVEPYMVDDWWQEGKLDKQGRDLLITRLSKGFTSTDNPLTVINLNKDLISPEVDKFAMYDRINKAAIEGEITVQTHEKFIDKLKGGSVDKIKNAPYYTQGLKNIESNIRTTGPLSTFTNAHEDLAIAEANDEYWDRVSKGEKPRTIWKDVLEKFKPVIEERGKVVWSANWVGTAAEPNFEATKNRLAEQKEAGQITEKEFVEQFSNLGRYEESYNLRQSR